ncbi:MAG TPA: hypothetical protein VN753_14780 [Terracidiphilus sp.]|nr:hypothetical protein [Terracidiphilus sp.]
MSAALQLPYLLAAANNRQRVTGVEHQRNSAPEMDEAVPQIRFAFYRKHTEKMLRRYLYASMLVGRAPGILGEPIGRGWASSRRVKTFEDAVIFVLDIERCLDQLGEVDRGLLSRIALQEYTHSEAADLLGYSVRAISYKYPMALDRLTELLLRAGLLIIAD